MARLKEMKQTKQAMKSERKTAAIVKLKATQKTKRANKFKRLEKRYPEAMKALLDALKDDAPCPLKVKKTGKESQGLTKKHARKQKKRLTKKTTFMDLPPEIRLLVYEYALTAAGPIRFRIQKDEAALQAALRAWNRERGSRSRIVGYPRPRTVYSLVVDPVKERGVRKISRKFGELHAPGLLRANRTIYNESWPVLYAQNRFQFKEAPALRQFDTMTNGAVLMFSDVEVRKVYPYHDRDFIAPILYSQKLRRLTLKLRPGFFYSDKISRLLAIMLSRPGPSSAHDILCASLGNGLCDCLTQIQQDRRINALEIVTSRSIDFKDGNGWVDSATQESQEKLRTEVKSWLNGPAETLLS